MCLPTLRFSSRVVFDPNYPSVDMGAYSKTDWKSMYGDVKEMTPPDAPVPLGKEVDLRLFVDSDNAGEQFKKNWVCDLLEHGSNCVFLQASADCGIKCVWI
jgi:hypothetical protein